MGATFKADDTFNVDGRGLVLSGIVTDGEVEEGMSFSIPSFPMRMRIQSVDFINYEGPKEGLVGLLCQDTSAEDVRNWRALDVRGLEVTIDNKDA